MVEVGRKKGVFLESDEVRQGAHLFFCLQNGEGGRGKREILQLRGNSPPPEERKKGDVMSTLKGGH